MLFNFIFFRVPYLVLLAKILVVCVFAILTRGTVPRYRFDQLTQLNWKFLLFFWIIFLSLSALYFVMFI